MTERDGFSSRRNIKGRPGRGKMKKFCCVLVIMAGIFWGTQGIFVNKLGETGFSAMDIAAIRVVGTGIIIFFVILAVKRELLRIQVRDIWIFAGSGLLSIIGFNCLYYMTIRLTSMSVAAVLLYISPAVVSVLSGILFREKMTLRKLIALISAFAGCFFVSGVLGGENTVTFQGVITGVGAGVAYALYSVFSSIGLKKGYHPVTVMTYTFLIGGAGILFLCRPAEIVAVSGKDGGLMLLETGFILISAVVPYFLYTVGLKYMEAGKASIMASTEAIAATLFGNIFFHEKLTVHIILGILAVVFSIIVLNVNMQMRRKSVVQTEIQSNGS